MDTRERKSAEGADFGWLQPTQDRLLQRHREITQAQADELDKRCRKAMETSFAIVAKVVEENGDVVQASGRVLDAFPWIDTDNLEHIWKIWPGVGSGWRSSI